MGIRDDQLELQRTYAFGIPGISVSGVVWLTAGLVCLLVSETAAIATFFVGGMLIFPVASLICQKGLGRTPAKGNPLGILGLETTSVLFVGLVLAYFGREQSAGYFFNTMLMIVGVRYLMFQTVYGLRHYWALGMALAYTGLGLFILRATWLPLAGLAGGGIEMGFAAWMWITLKHPANKAT